MNMLLQTPSTDWKDYELLDSGGFEKLERFGKYILIRPEPKALWDKSLSPSKWKEMAHALFKTGAGFSKSGKEDSGTWEMLKRMPEQWFISYPLSKTEKITLRLGLTSFKHVGLFPEQAPNWDRIYTETQRVKNIKKGPVKVLNLFAYTGAASLVARCAGADVTHLDSVKQVVTWANKNMEFSSLDNIRWVVEDAMKFVKREAKRGNQYNGLILDPPAYGHGPDGERWKLDECLFELLTYCNKILAQQDSFLILNLYSNGYSSVLADSLIRDVFRISEQEMEKNGEFGELILQDRAGRKLPLSVFSRAGR